MYVRNYTQIPEPSVKPSNPTFGKLLFVFQIYVSLASAFLFFWWIVLGLMSISIISGAPLLFLGWLLGTAPWPTFFSILWRSTINEKPEKFEPHKKIIIGIGFAINVTLASPTTLFFIESIINQREILSGLLFFSVMNAPVLTILIIILRGRLYGWLPDDTDPTQTEPGPEPDHRAPPPAV